MDGVWIVLANCGDHYCGCDGGHVVGVSPTAEEAGRIKTEAEEARHATLDFRLWSSVSPPVMVPLNTLLDGGL